MTKHDIALLALKSLLKEVSLYPKPGLVDPIDCGSHTDMDYITFIDSACELVPGFERYYEVGAHHDGPITTLLDVIRITGIENESAMFKATHSINTHKGANFMFGVVIAVMGYLNNPDYPTLRKGICDMTQGLVERELSSISNPTTHGERMYIMHGFTGIRGEVEAGIPHVFEIALPLLIEGNADEKSMKRALLALIASNDDSNMVKRGGVAGLKFGKELASQPYNDLDEHLRVMNTSFKEKNLSPGGSADLLALALFIYDYNIHLVQEKNVV